MFRRSIYQTAGGLLLAALGAVSGCDRGTQGAAAFQMPPPRVDVATVVAGPAPIYLDEIGKTAASEMVTIIPQVSGKITARSFEDGADLKKGQALFSIDPRPFQAALDAANASVQQNEAQLTTAQTNFDRLAQLIATKAVAQQDYDTAKDNVAVAVANVKAAEAQVETAQLNLNYCSITSPIAGRAGQRLVDAGNVVTANTTQLLVIEQIEPIYADFTIAENNLDRVRTAMSHNTLKTLINSGDSAEGGAEGNVIFLDNSVQDGTGTIRLRAVIPNTDRRFWPGQFVHVRLILANVPDALMMPNEAVQIGQQGEFVFVVSDGKAEMRPVKLGERQGSMVVIDSGLEAGETVVVNGQLAVRPGFPVVVNPPPAAAPTTQPDMTSSSTEPSTMPSEGAQ